MSDRTKAVILAAGHSLWITATAIACGILAAAYVAHQDDSIPHLIAFIQAHWLETTVSILVAPSIRASIAAKKGTS